MREGGDVRIGLDLGGTKIEIVALAEDGRQLLRRRVPTPVGSYKQTLRALTDLVLAAERELSTTGTVGLGAPGALSQVSGLIKNASSTWLNGRALDCDLGRLLNRRIWIENDANCFALSEAIDGAGANSDMVFGVILGTGVGGGICADKKIIVGRNRIAGEWGHNSLPWPQAEEYPGETCYCGRKGCIETFLSGSGLAREYRKQTNVALPAEVIASRVAVDEAASVTVSTYQGRLARALAAVINVLDPDIVVLGGGLSNIHQLYNGLDEAIAKYVFSDHLATHVVPCLHGDSSGVRGAAWLPNDSRNNSEGSGL